MKDSPIGTLANFVAECCRRRVVAGSIGHSDAHHLQLLAMRRDLGITVDIAHFSGGSAAHAKLIGGHLDASIAGPASASRALDNLQIVGAFEPQRSNALADTPTVAQQGLAVQNASQMLSRSIRFAVPIDRCAALTIAFREAFSEAEQISRMRRQGAFPALMEPERIVRNLRAEAALVNAFKDELQG